MLQYVPEPETLHRGIRRLESGTTFTASARRPGGDRRYFAPRFADRPVRPAQRAACYDEITAVLEDSVAKHMRADVTVGAFLSGGIDSTAIAALAMRHNPRPDHVHHRLRARGLLRGRRRRRVGRGDRRPARRQGGQPPQEFVAALPEIVWYLDEPVADPALVPLFFVAREARKHVKVVLSGEGADELFGGYTIYREPLSLEPFDYLPGRLRRSMAKVAKPLPEGMRGKSLLHRGSLTLEERYYGNARSFSDDRAAAVLRTCAGVDPHRRHRAGLRPDRTGWDPVARMQHIDLFTWLRGDILVKADKMTMANSLELRVPFLDPEVFAVASTAAAEPEDHQDHHQVRAAPGAGADRPAARAEPAEARLPGADPALARGRVLTGRTRSSSSARRTEYLIDLAAVRRMLDEHRAGTTDHSRRLWTVLIFMLWHAIFVERQRSPRRSASRLPGPALTVAAAGR